MNVSLKPENMIVAAQQRGGTDNRDLVEAIKRSIAAKPPKRDDFVAAINRPQPIVIDNTRVNLRFRSDKESGIEVIQVIDAASGELVRQIPAEELLNIAKALRDLKGLLVSKEL
jgi:flagellar protein FlaG